MSGNENFSSSRSAFVCKSKVKYSNLKSANRAKMVLSKAYDTKFEIYQCGQSKHYHLTHKYREQSIGHGNQFNRGSK